MVKYFTNHVLPIIVISQLFCTSVWFAGNAILPDLINNLQLGPGFLAPLTSAVQFGFITGTLIFAILTIADRFSPSRVFCICALLAGIVNLGMLLEGIHSTGLLIIRFIVGFLLAGIYPVGMKIASDHFGKNLGKSLGLLVGALVVGTAFPHLLKSLTGSLPWHYVVYLTSGIAALGGVLMFFVPDGPLRKAAQKIKVTAFLIGFRNKNFRSAAFGYFGHMWELYTFWAFVPIILGAYKNHFTEVNFNIPLLSFLIIASGGVACVIGGLISQYYGAKRVALSALILSCICCLISPLFLTNSSVYVFITFLVFWGLVVIADSPLFSTLVANYAPEESRGTSLTIVNCIGFSITIISIQFINGISEFINNKYLYIFLALGPLMGIFAMIKNKSQTSIIGITPSINLKQIL